MKRLTAILSVFAAVLLLASPLYASAPAGDRKNTADEPLIEFNHKYMDIHLKMRLTKLKTMNKLMPKSLRNEIKQDYYPEMRSRLTTEDRIKVKDGEACVERFDDGKIKLTLEFFNFEMIISNATWEQVDEVFREYF